MSPSPPLPLVGAVVAELVDAIWLARPIITVDAITNKRGDKEAGPVAVVEMIANVAQLLGKL